MCKKQKKRQKEQKKLRNGVGEISGVLKMKPEREAWKGGKPTNFSGSVTSVLKSSTE